MDGNVFQVYTFEEVVRYGIALLFFFSMLLAVCYTIWGGFLMVVSGGSEEKVKAAVNHMRYAVLGIIVLSLVLYVAPIFLGFFGLSQYGDYFRPQVIMGTIQEVSAKMLGGQASGGYYDATIDSNSPTSDDFTTL